MKLEQWLNARWYGRPGMLYAFWPLECLFRALAALRRRNTRPQRCSAPVIVVGNIAVGGSGKTPAVLAIAQHLQQRGWRPGIVSRGYGGKAAQYPLFVTNATQPSEAGDEPCLMARRSGLPVAVAPDRVAAANLLVDEHACNVIISDDGLQHYALGRSVELVLLDQQRDLGNRRCLPEGPLREPAERLQSVDLVVRNGATADGPKGYAMQLAPGVLVNLVSGERVAANRWSGSRQVAAMAGIGNPERFFATLQTLAFECETYIFADHARYDEQMLAPLPANKPLLMTEKDAVKCAAIARDNWWYLSVDAKLSDDFATALLALLPAPERACEAIQE